jgi:hypothetical protein
VPSVIAFAPPSSAKAPRAAAPADAQAEGVSFPEAIRAAEAVEASAAAAPSGASLTGAAPSGVSPAGVSPAGVSPAAVSPAAVSPAAVSPAASQPVSGTSSAPANAQLGPALVPAAAPGAKTAAPVSAAPAADAPIGSRSTAEPPAPQPAPAPSRSIVPHAGAGTSRQDDTVADPLHDAADEPARDALVEHRTKAAPRARGTTLSSARATSAPAESHPTSSRPDAAPRAASAGGDTPAPAKAPLSTPFPALSSWVGRGTARSFVPNGSPSVVPDRPQLPARGDRPASSPGPLPAEHGSGGAAADRAPAHAAPDRATPGLPQEPSPAPRDAAGGTPLEPPLAVPLPPARTAPAHAGRPAGPTPAEVLLRATPGLDRQLAQKARELLARGHTQIRVTLDPPALGKLRVELDVSENRIVARIVATNPDALVLLQQDKNELVRSFQQAGIDDVTVNVESEARDTARGRDEEDRRGDGTKGAPAPAEAGMPQQERTARERSNRLVDLVA